jgi:hypothetical protein
MCRVLRAGDRSTALVMLTNPFVVLSLLHVQQQSEIFIGKAL